MKASILSGLNGNRSVERFAAITSGDVYIYDKPMTYQFYAYGVPGNCTQTDSKLCNGFASFATPVGDRLDHSFVLTTDNKLVAKSTGLYVLYIHVTQAMVDNLAKPWSLWHISDEIFFPISPYNVEGDVVPVTWVSTNATSVPTTVNITKYAYTSTGWKPTTTVVSTQVTAYTSLTDTGDWIIQKPNGNMTKLQLDVVDKQAMLHTVSMNVPGLWSFSAPGRAASCGENQIFVNGACQTCPAGQQPDAAKVACVPVCSPPYFFLNNSCQLCDPTTGDISPDGTRCLPKCTGTYPVVVSKSFAKKAWALITGGSDTDDVVQVPMHKTTDGNCAACINGKTWMPGAPSGQYIGGDCVDKCPDPLEPVNGVCGCPSGYLTVGKGCKSVFAVLVAGLILVNFVLIAIFKANIVDLLRLDITIIIFYFIYTLLTNPEAAGKGLFAAIGGVAKGLWSGLTSIF
jgi:hypothetical protein